MRAKRKLGTVGKVIGCAVLLVISLFQISSAAVRMIEIMIWSMKQFPSVFSADSLSFFPMKIDALGAPPYPTRAAKAETIMISGIQTPTPVRAVAPISGICPI